MAIRNVATPKANRIVLKARLLFLGLSIVLAKRFCIFKKAQEYFIEIGQSRGSSLLRIRGKRVRAICTRRTRARTQNMSMWVRIYFRPTSPPFTVEHTIKKILNSLLSEPEDNAAGKFPFRFCVRFLFTRTVMIVKQKL